MKGAEKHIFNCFWKAYFLLLLKCIFSTTIERYIFYCWWRAYFELLFKLMYSTVIERDIVYYYRKVYFLLVTNRHILPLFTAAKSQVFYCCVKRLKGIFSTAVESNIYFVLSEGIFFTIFERLLSTTAELQIFFFLSKACFLLLLKAIFLLLLKGIFSTAFQSNHTFNCYWKVHLQLKCMFSTGGGEEVYFLLCLQLLKGIFFTAA